MRARKFKIYVALIITGLFFAALIPSVAFIQAREVTQTGPTASKNIVVAASQCAGTIGATSAITAAAATALTAASKEGSSESSKGATAKQAY